MEEMKEKGEGHRQGGTREEPIMEKGKYHWGHLQTKARTGAAVMRLLHYARNATHLRAKLEKLLLP